MRTLTWLWRAFLFFLLFAFALKNQHVVEVKGFFGYTWQASMVFVILGVFGVGCATGVMAMVPSWWRHRRDARKRLQVMGQQATPAGKAQQPSAAEADSPTTMPPQLPQPPDVAAPRKPVR
ncbi:MAG TPA: LapA family protein [Aquabacterium sp.]|nr:LapA family protein [Aquabacterium sp.]HRH29147.1 LapA family protein [Aquabacterium sp.]